MTKLQSRLSVREQKADALDTLVKAEVARTKALNAAKIARLKAFRLAQDETNATASRHPAEGRATPRKTMHLRRFC